MVASDSLFADLALTPTERRILETLRAQPGRVFSRRDLIGVVIGTIVLERTIDVHIRGLRRKLGPHAQLIRTVRGGGYCLGPPNT